ncbi:hypothetical protein PR048_024151 [Dryococelus australis]|uniref:Uncharacterized protein n=1 Tax=Dryococelus australis TaxID=614101 RepID=A0ABQ9GW27_9NEOP|nr:hypothetical protein PR048_024151 [Dryococelus australis]
MYIFQRYKDEMTFDPKCKVVVVRRMIEQNQDYRFNPLLQKGCHLDIPKFCADVVATEPQDKELEGKVIKCLKVNGTLLVCVLSVSEYIDCNHDIFMNLMCDVWLRWYRRHHQI